MSAIQTEVELDADLESVPVCEWCDGCDAPATWRMRLRHLRDCDCTPHVVLYCAVHRSLIHQAVDYLSTCWCARCFRPMDDAIEGERAL